MEPTPYFIDQSAHDGCCGQYNVSHFHLLGPFGIPSLGWIALEAQDNLPHWGQEPMTTGLAGQCSSHCSTMDHEIRETWFNMLAFFTRILLDEDVRNFVLENQIQRKQKRGCPRNIYITHVRKDQGDERRKRS